MENMLSNIYYPLRGTKCRQYVHVQIGWGWCQIRWGLKEESEDFNLITLCLRFGHSTGIQEGTQHSTGTWQRCNLISFSSRTTYGNKKHFLQTQSSNNTALEKLISWSKWQNFQKKCYHYRYLCLIKLLTLHQDIPSKIGRLDVHQ